ncbi:MAG TPA: cation-translocating P-type ATPase [Acidiferrobacterales bacterium]|nr:cation-translocating P-type ATPase [Acidiferrobacterales bacterium]
MKIFPDFPSPEAFRFDRLSGLSPAEASIRLHDDGYNELPSAKPRRFLSIMLQVVSEPMLLLLLAIGTIYLLIGDPINSVVLFVSIIVIAGISLYQEHKTERTLEALRDLSSPRARVIRDGKQIRIPGREVVRGDIVVLAEGDRVPADAVLIFSINLFTDESLLTGESVQVHKRAREDVAQIAPPGGDGSPYVYAGSLVVRGQALARVLAIGMNTEIGKIGKALQSIKAEPTTLQRETRRIVRVAAMLGIGLSILVTIGYGLTRQDWINGLLAGLTLAIAILPEEFPVVLTIFLALGAWRLSRQHVLTRRVAAIEMLGAATVLCVDKTGTLTLNRMAVHKLYANGQYYDVAAHDGKPVPETFHSLMEFGILASQREPFDPMDKALRALEDIRFIDTAHLHHRWTLVHEYPLSAELLALSEVWQGRQDEDYVVAAKGAPEAIMDLCHLGDEERDALASHVGNLAAEGLRVLGVARARFHASPLPRDQHEFAFAFVGLIGLADPVRPTVPAALEECDAAGIRVVMITGDYPATAQSIAGQIGLKGRERVMTGAELEGLSDDTLRRHIKNVNLFARMVPAQKLRLVNALKANGDIVAMTGDGVNDAPALKAAHIGIAMGERGTDVAREAADLVLLDDDFASIVRAVAEGRHIYNNIKKAMAYLVAIHIPIAGMSLIPVLIQAPLLLLPVHILFMELIIDPASSVVFEVERGIDNLMRRKPRAPNAPLFNESALILSLLQGLGVLAVLLVIYWWDIYHGSNEAYSRTKIFATLAAANLSLVHVNRSWSHTVFSSLPIPNAPLWWVSAAAFIVLLLALYMPALRSLFHFTPLSAFNLTACIVTGMASVAWFELNKLRISRARAL